MVNCTSLNVSLTHSHTHPTRMDRFFRCTRAKSTHTREQNRYRTCACGSKSEEAVPFPILEETMGSQGVEAKNK